MHMVKSVKTDKDGALLETVATEVLPAASSVVLKLSAKGELMPEIKVYDIDPDAAADKAMEIMKRVLAEASR